MIVAYVLKMYPRFSETFILNEILELERQGVEVRIFSHLRPDDGRFHASLAKVQAKVTYLPEHPMDELARVLPICARLARRDKRRFWGTLWYALTHPSDLGHKRFLRACVLADMLQAEPVDHMHAHFASSATSMALMAHRLTGIPYSFTAHAKDIYLNSVDQRLLRDKIRAARFVVTVSDFNQAYLTGLSAAAELDKPAGVQPPHIRRLYNGIDLGQFAPASTPHVDAATGAPLILSVGRLVEKKGFEDLIRACALLRHRGVKFTCAIIGKGPREAALKQLIAELKLADAVHLLGPKPQDQVVSVYQRATLFALPCIVGADGNRDGLPTVLLEAMAMGLPIISTELTGVPEIVDNGVSGLLVPPQDPASLAEAITRLFGDPALRGAMGRAARLKVNRDFDLRQNVSVLHQWFTETLRPEPLAAGLLAPADLLKESQDEHTLPVR